MRREFDNPILHICAPASPVAETLPSFEAGDWPGLQRAVGRAIGPGWQVRGRADLIWGAYLPEDGGRQDDADRAADLMAAFADERVRAIVALRGGAWLLRILERIDLRVLQRRRNPVWLFGFSEWTCLSLAAARYRSVISVHHVTPLYMLGSDPHKPLSDPQKQRRWREIWASIRTILAGGDPGRPLTGRLLTDHELPRQPVRLIGGNLTLMAAMAGTKYQRAARPGGAWLALEDINESIGACDRKLTQMRLAGLFDEVAGVLVGGFHHEGQNLSPAVGRLLRMHLPPRVPIVAGCNFGHFWPAAAFPVGRAVRVVMGPRNKVEVRIDWNRLAQR